EMLIDFGTLKTTAGFMVSYFQLLGIPVSMIMPVLAMKLKSQSTLVFSVNILFMSGLILLLLQNSFTMVLIAVSFIGLASSSNFALALTFLSIRAKNAQDAADLSGMAQSVGYILAATGPILIGSIYDMTDGWTIPIFCLIIVVIGILYFGSRAGQHRYVFYADKETNNTSYKINRFRYGWYFNECTARGINENERSLTTSHERGCTRRIGDGKTYIDLRALCKGITFKFVFSDNERCRNT